MNAAVRVMLAVVLVAGAGPVGFLLYRLVFSTHAPVVAASAPESAPAAGVPPQAALPQQLPGLALPDAAGVRHRLTDYRGAPLVLNFWASWCEPCRREIPLLEALHHSRPGLQLVGVAVDFDADARRFAHSVGIDYPVLLGENEGLAVINALGMDTALPFTVFADARGEILTVRRGELHAGEADLILGRVAAVDRGQLTPAAARQQISDGLRTLALVRTGAAPASQGTSTSGKVAQSEGKDTQTSVN
jgi:thiol-disulfide isomerase/thioredoxin